MCLCSRIRKAQSYSGRSDCSGLLSKRILQAHLLSKRQHAPKTVPPLQEVKKHVPKIVPPLQEAEKGFLSKRPNKTFQRLCLLSKMQDTASSPRGKAKPRSKDCASSPRGKPRPPLQEANTRGFFLDVASDEALLGRVPTVWAVLQTHTLQGARRETAVPHPDHQPQPPATPPQRRSPASV